MLGMPQKGVPIISMPRFPQKSVVITGGGRGIGAACADLFVKEGAKVTIASRTEKELLKSKSHIEKKHGATDAVLPVVTAPSG